MTRVVVFGTFDMIHEGHEAFFGDARALANDPHLIVSIARDSNAERVKGVRPKCSERKRLSAVDAHPLVDEAVLGADTDYAKHVAELKPDIIALGYDQEGEYVDHLADDLSKVGMHPRIVRLNAHKPHLYKTSLLQHSTPPPPRSRNPDT